MSETNAPLTLVEVAMETALTREVLETVATRHGSHAARACAMSTSVGGIGPLLKERIIAQAETGVHVIGVSLLYESTWVQNWYSWGQMYLEKRKAGPYLRDCLQEAPFSLSFSLFDGTPVTARVWSVPYGKATVYFLDAPEITNVIYPSPDDAALETPNPSLWAEKMRLAQSWLVGRGTLALLQKLNVKPQIIVQSETPTFFAHPKLVDDAFTNDPLFAETRTVFNDHTPLEYAHPQWPSETLKWVKVRPELLQDESLWNKTKTAVDITRLLVKNTNATYGVSEKHGRVMREMASLKGLEEKIDTVTNGVSLEYWQSPVYRNTDTLNDADLIKVKEKKKTEFIDWLWRRYKLWHTWKDAATGRPILLWTRRVTGYKRLDVLYKLLKDDDLRRRFLNTGCVLLAGGRIHQNDGLSQGTIFDLLDLLERYQEQLSHRVVVLDNFNVFEAPKLFQSVDASIMLADEGREASATGFMKAQVNGSAIIASEDGAVPESVFFEGRSKDHPVNGFEVPYSGGQPTAEGFLRAIESFTQVYNDPARRAAMIRSALKAVPMVSVERTTHDLLALYRRVLAPPEPSPASIPS